MSNPRDQLDALVERVDGLATLTAGISRGQRTLQDTVVGLYKPRSSTPPTRMSGAERFAKHAVLRVLAKPGFTPQDAYQRYYARSAVAPASSTTPGWANELIWRDFADFLMSGATPSILPQLAALGTSLDLDAPITVPYVPTGGPARGAWVAEGSPIPAGSVQLLSALLSPRKAAVISTFSAELADQRIPNVEKLVGNVLQNDLRKLIDSALVDDQPASPSRPAGLRWYSAALPAGVSLQEDIAHLLEALLTAGGTAPVLIINPLQSISLSSLPSPLAFPVLSTVELEPDTVLMLDAGSFISSLGQPEIRSSESALIHEETAPAAIGAPGSPAVVAAPSRSTWQTNTVALKTVVKATWELVGARVKWITDVVW